MKEMKRFLAVFLSVCMSCYTLPVFAAQSNVANSSEAAVIVSISDQQMIELVGGSGGVDAKVSDYPSAGEDASAVIVNRSSSLTLPYSLVGTDIGRNVTEVIASGSLSPNTAIIVNGPVTSPSTYVLQAKIGGTGIRALESIDSTLK